MTRTPSPIVAASADDDGVRRLAGACYLAMASGDPAWLHALPSVDSMQRSGLGATWANLRARHGMQAPREAAMAGMHLSAGIARRWERLRETLASARTAGFSPVLFKGGAIHARWPETRETRPLSDYDLIVPQAEADAFRAFLARRGFRSPPMGSRLTRWLSKGWMVWRGEGPTYENLDIHARVTEPPMCTSLTRSILGSRESRDGLRIPDAHDSACMIALHVARSGMHRPLHEYLDLLRFVDGMADADWLALQERARRHHLRPALFAALRQALHCLALRELDPARAAALEARIDALGRRIGALRRHALDRIAAPDHPLHPAPAQDRPLVRRSLVFWAGTESSGRVMAAFVLYGGARLLDRFPGASTPAGEDGDQAP